MANEVKILLPNESPLFTVESITNLIFQTVMRSCYQPGKILCNAWWERTSPEARRIWKAKLSERGTKCQEEKETFIIC